MEATRQAELSFLTWLREDWFIRQSEDPVWKNRSSIALSLSGGIYSATGYFNWIYYVPSGVAGVNYPPVISDDTGTISSSNYSINYLRGEVTFSGYTPTGTVNAQFAHLNHSIRLSGEPLYDLERVRLPSITVDEVSSEPEPLQLGGGDNVAVRFVVQIREYARRTYLAEPRASEVADIITRGLTSQDISIIDFSTYFPLSHSGNRVSAYDRATQEDGHYSVDTGIGRIRNSRVVVAADPVGVARRQIEFTLYVSR